MANQNNFGGGLHEEGRGGRVGEVLLGTSLCDPKGYSFFSCVGQKLGIDFGNSQIGYDVCTLVLYWVCFLEEATMGPKIKAPSQ